MRFELGMSALSLMLLAGFTLAFMAAAAHEVAGEGVERHAGKLAVNDISKRWNDDMQTLLDIKVPSDDKGCLQDVHW